MEPDTMSKDPNTVRLAADGREVMLVGTAHVSRESADLVSQVILRERPDTVAVELCESRYQALTKKKQWENTDLIKVVREKKAFLLLSNLMLSSFQKRIGKKLGINPGEEMLQAVRTAEDLGSRVYLADRDVRITLARAWRLMGLWKKIKLLVQLIMPSSNGIDAITQEDIEKMKEKDVLDALLTEMGEKLPELRRILIDERDQYLAHKIHAAPGNRIVAVVGAGHIPGIQAHWGKPIDLHGLEEIPPGSKLTAILKWGVPALVLGMVTAGFFTAGAAAGAEMIKWWILANALFAGLGAAVALGRPLTVLSAVLASPVTSINPLIAAGWVAGLTEAFLGKPKVKDFESLPDDIISARGFWKNKITRILLVVVFTNVGSSLGTFVAIPLMVKVFA
jgi:pheromone shutdown-related protein TraB